MRNIGRIGDYKHPAEIAKALGGGCILCGKDPATFVGIFVPDRAWRKKTGVPLGGNVAYLICDAHDMNNPATQIEVEDRMERHFATDSN